LTPADAHGHAYFRGPRRDDSDEIHATGRVRWSGDPGSDGDRSSERTRSLRYAKERR